MATDVDPKELGPFESRSENAEKSWLGMVVGFVAINQFFRDSVTSVHVCPKSSAIHTTLSLKVRGMRGVVRRDGSALRRAHKTSDAVHDSRGWLPETWRSWSRVILRRNGDSHLVSVEFEDDLQGSKKSMSRDFTRLMTHENCDVAGYSAVTVVDERRVARSTIELPRCEAVESQMSVGSSSRCSTALCMYLCEEQRSSNSHCNNAGRVAGRFLPQHHWRGQHSHIVLSDNYNTTCCNPGFTGSILTECVRAHGTMRDRKNAAFEETDAAQDEDPWEYDIAPRKGPVPHPVRGAYVSVHELSYLRSSRVMTKR